MKYAASLLSLWAASIYGQQVRVIARPGILSQPKQATVYSGGADYVSDIIGEPDHQNWGRKGYQDTVLTFSPPSGYRVQIVAVDSSVSSFARGAVPYGTHSGVSWGLITTDTSPSVRADLLNDHCMAYLKQSISAAKDTDTSTAHFDIQNGLLGADNKLISRNAVYLNETGLAIHTEVALVITYQFVPSAE